ncbi:MAG: hypothetical protein Kow0088_02700 [Anaerolineales bacterium]
MGITVEEVILRKHDLWSVECPAGCRFLIVCWLVSASEVPQEIIWFCLGKVENEPLKDVPIGAWAYRPGDAIELELDND